MGAVVPTDVNVVGVANASVSVSVEVEGGSDGMQW